MLLAVLTASFGTVDLRTGILISDNPVFQVSRQCVEPSTEWPANGPWGGNVRTMATSFGNDDIVIAGTWDARYCIISGIWRSLDGGVTWTRTGPQGLEVMGVCAAPPSTFYAATMEGLYASYDDGATWSAVPGMSTPVIDIGASPADPSLLIVGLASSAGIRRSTDGGATWEEVGLSTGFMKGFGCDPDHPDTMYVAMSGLSQPLYRSTDGGDSWTPMGPAGNGRELLVAPLGSGETIILSHTAGFYVSHDYGATWASPFSGQTAFCNAVSDGVNIYAPNRSILTSDGIYESTDGGYSWTLNSSGIVSALWGGACVSSQGVLVGHFGGVYRSEGVGEPYEVSQTGMTHALVMAVSYLSSTGTLFAGAMDSGLWKSTDAGETWSIITPGLDDWSIHDIAPESEVRGRSEVMYVATDHGLFRSNDSGETWFPAGLDNTYLHSVLFDPSDPERVWAGWFGWIVSGEVFYSTDGGASWGTASGFVSPGIWFSIELVDIGEDLLRVIASCIGGDGIYWSDDGGISFNRIALLEDVFGLSATGDQDPVVYAACGTGVMRSFDEGLSWEPCPGFGQETRAILGSGEQVFAGTWEAGVWRSQDQGDTWSWLDSPVGYPVTDMVYADEPGNVFAAVPGLGVQMISTGPEGVEEQNPGVLSVNAVPNPFSAAVDLSVRKNGSGPVILRVFDMSGRLMTALECRDGVGTWSPEPATPPGVYFIVAEGSGRTATAKVVLLR